MQRRLVSLGVLLLLLVVSGWGVGFDGYRLVQGLPRMLSLLERMLSPDINYISEVWPSLLLTGQMALAGTLLGTVLALPLAFLAARNLTPWPWLGRGLRQALSITRAIPHLFWAALIVSILGPGSAAGILALGLTSANIVAKLLREYLEDMDNRPLDALRGAGAPWWVAFALGVFPRLWGQLGSLFFYCLEVNIRGAAVLGMVGAGGIGQLLWRDLNFLRYDRVATLSALLFVTVALTDGISLLSQHLVAGNYLPVGRSFFSYRAWFWLKVLAGASLLGGSLAWSLGQLGMTWAQVQMGAAQVQIILTRSVQPDWSFLPTILKGTRETMAISVFATLVGSIIAFFLALVGTSSLVRHPLLALVGKVPVNILRTFPVVVAAIMFFRGVGPGPLAGALALSVYTAGVLGKLYTEAMEQVKEKLLEPLRATGASWLQVWRWGVLPRAIPGFIAASLFRLESNIRNATVLGMVGAGGLGTSLNANISARNWERVGLLILAIALLALTADYLSSRLRRAL